MTPEQLADEVQQFIHVAMSRVGPDSIGAKQYHDPVTNTQGFERYSLEKMRDMCGEELYDVANYAVMTSIMFNRMFAQVIAARDAALSQIVLDPENQPNQWGVVVPIDAIDNLLRAAKLVPDAVLFKPSDLDAVQAFVGAYRAIAGS